MAAREPESDHQSLHRRGRALASFALDHKACKDSYAMKPIENPSGFLAHSLDRQPKGAAYSSKIEVFTFEGVHFERPTTDRDAA